MLRTQYIFGFYWYGKQNFGLFLSDNNRNGFVDHFFYSAIKRKYQRINGRTVEEEEEGGGLNKIVIVVEKRVTVPKNSRVVVVVCVFLRRRRRRRRCALF